MAKANALTLPKEYLVAIDKVYAQNALTSILEVNNQFMKEGRAAGEVMIPKISMDGLGNYDRTTGFVDGAVTLEWETHKMKYDRGRKFNVDEADNIESANIAFGMLAGEFTRTKVVPEVDAIRFSILAEGAGTKSEIAITADNIVSELKKMETAWNEAEVPQEGRILFISWTAKALLEQSKEYQAQRIINATQAGSINDKVEMFNSLRLIGVPQSRFYSKIDLNDGKTGGQEAGGFKKNTAGKEINFLGVHMGAINAYSKIDAPRIFTPEQNQNARAWQYDYRKYHDLWILENKAKGVYVCTKP